MTAEVCVMNRLGIAIAADSAVTVSSKGEKIYTSVDKMFNLSNDAPVGVMIYGGASFLELMWETIVKEYRRRLGDQQFDLLSGYADDFLLFLTDLEVFPENVQDQQVSMLVHIYFGHILERIGMRLNAEAEQLEGLDEEDYPPIITDELGNILSELSERDLLEEFDEATITKISHNYKDIFLRARSQIFEDLKLEPTAVLRLNRIGLEFLTRDVFGPLESGVVIAGFGEKELYPRLYSFRIEGRVLGKLRMVREHQSELSAEISASVIPFAQQEMVHTFMNGIDPEFNEFIKSTTRSSLMGAIENISAHVSEMLPEFKADIAPVVNEASEQLLLSMFRQWQENQQNYWMPVIDIVNSLPKDELASMAEALVNLTKFRRRVTPELETVGGPIDVAVITRGDGFVWVKRKHYFSAELNPRIMARYLKEANYEQN